MDTEEQPYDDRHEPRPKAFDSWSTTLDDAVKYLQDSVDRAEVKTRMTSSIRVVLGALRDRTAAEETPQVKQTPDDPWALGYVKDVDPPLPGTPLDTQTGLRYIAPGGKFAAYWGGQGEGPYLAQISLLDLRILSAYLTTAIDLVTAELELRRK